MANQIITVYLTCEDFLRAEELFQQIKEPILQNFNGMMSYYNKISRWQQTVELYDKMKAQRKIQLDVTSYVNALTAVNELKNVDKKMEIQADILKQNLWQNHDDIKKFFQS